MNRQPTVCSPWKRTKTIWCCQIKYNRQQLPLHPSYWEYHVSAKTDDNLLAHFRKIFDSIRKYSLNNFTCTCSKCIYLSNYFERGILLYCNRPSCPTTGTSTWCKYFMLFYCTVPYCSISDYWKYLYKYLYGVRNYIFSGASRDGAIPYVLCKYCTNRVPKYSKVQKSSK